jgi:hypothetical protein
MMRVEARAPALSPRTPHSRVVRNRGTHVRSADVRAGSIVDRPHLDLGGFSRDPTSLAISLGPLLRL